MKTLTAAFLLSLLAASAAEAKIQTKTVAYEHDGEALEGLLVWDDAVSGKRPGVLVVHEWWGLNEYAKMRAEKLAGLGYVAFAGDMYGKGKVTEHPEKAMEWVGMITQNVEAWQSRAQTALDVLAKHELVDPDRLAAVGYCFGGATVCQLAYAGAPLRGIVSFHGSLPIPDPDAAKGIRAKMLLCHGAADSFVAADHIVKLTEALNAAGVDWELAMYGGAMHSFTVPDAGSHGIPGLAYSREADERSWARMEAFFAEIFR